MLLLGMIQYLLFILSIVIIKYVFSSLAWFDSKTKQANNQKIFQCSITSFKKIDNVSIQRNIYNIEGTFFSCRIAVGRPHIEVLILYYSSRPERLMLLHMAFVPETTLSSAILVITFRNKMCKQLTMSRILLICILDDFSIVTSSISRTQ